MLYSISLSIKYVQSWSNLINQNVSKCSIYEIYTLFSFFRWGKFPLRKIFFNYQQKHSKCIGIFFGNLFFMKNILQQKLFYVETNGAKFTLLGLLSRPSSVRFVTKVFGEVSMTESVRPCRVRPHKVVGGNLVCMFSVDLVCQFSLFLPTNL